jgi:TolB-like protein
MPPPPADNAPLDEQGRRETMGAATPEVVVIPFHALGLPPEQRTAEDGTTPEVVVRPSRPAEA